MSKNKNNTFRYTVGDKVFPTLLTKEVFRDVDKYVPELLLGRVKYKDVLDGIIKRVSNSLPPKEANTIFEINGGKETIGTYLEHLSKLGQYSNGLTKVNEEVIEMYFTYKRSA